LVGAHVAQYARERVAPFRASLGMHDAGVGDGRIIQRGVRDGGGDRGIVARALLRVRRLLIASRLRCRRTDRLR